MSEISLHPPATSTSTQRNLEEQTRIDHILTPEGTNNINCSSYKFSRPRLYTPNYFPDSGETIVDRLRYLSQNIGPKDRTQSYKDSVTRLLQLSKPKHVARDKQYIVSVNSINTGPAVKLVHLDFDTFTVPALVDTGSTHCLISVEQYQKLSSILFIPLKLHMQVAGHTLKDNVIGKAQLPVRFKLPLVNA